MNYEQLIDWAVGSNVAVSLEERCTIGIMKGERQRRLSIN